MQTNSGETTPDSAESGITLIEDAGVGSVRSMAEDVLWGLKARHKWLPPKYFYDEAGSRLFEEICELDEYYQTRTERSILARISPDLLAEYAPRTLVEFGSGSSTKTRLLLDAMIASRGSGRYLPIDISRTMLLDTAQKLRSEYPALEIRPVVGDFSRQIPIGEIEAPALVIFLGGTIGNFNGDEAVAFIRGVTSAMGPEDLFLLGIDLVKDARELHAAYNDAAGVTARFNLNVLNVINRELGGEFDTSKFAHYAFYNPSRSRIEMHLSSLVEQTVRIESLGRSFSFGRGETILTEISRKFTPGSVARLLEDGGMSLLQLFTDPEERFGLALARRSPATES